MRMFFFPFVYEEVECNQKFFDGNHFPIEGGPKRLLLIKIGLGSMNVVVKKTVQL